MPVSAELTFDVATALFLGKREVQEDALVSDFPKGSDQGFVVLSDGMGGHEAGDVASNIVVTEVVGALKRRGSDADTPETVRKLLFDAARSANRSLSEHAKANPATSGMGATLVAPIAIKDRLFWISIGDSPLFLFRDNKLTQLNEDHSLGPQIDYMVKSGVLSEREGRNHPDRNCLTSALVGEDVPQIDCPEEPFQLKDGDLVIAASDGLQFLSDSHIQKRLAAAPGAGASEVADLLLADIKKLNDPHQDNVGLSVIRVSRRAAMAANPSSVKPKAKSAAKASMPPAKEPEAEPQPWFALGANVLFGKLRHLSASFTR